MVKKIRVTDKTYSDENKFRRNIFSLTNNITQQSRNFLQLCHDTTTSPSVLEVDFIGLYVQGGVFIYQTNIADNHKKHKSMIIMNNKQSKIKT